MRKGNAVRRAVLLGLACVAWNMVGCEPGQPPATRDSGTDAGDGDGDGDGDGVRWSPAFDTATSGALFGVWGSAPDDVFIVGGTDTTGEAYHFDGEAWEPMAVSVPGALIWVTGFAADNVYAVGLGGTVLHYDGERWEALDSGVEAPLWGIFGFDDSDIWIVGGDTEQTEPDPMILRYDGTTFERVTLERAENPRGARALFKVWGVDDRLFAVGHRGQIVTYRDGRWVNSPGGAAADQDFVSLWGTSGDNIVAVGGRANARIARFDGDGWTTRGEPGQAGIIGVHMLDADEAIVVGDRGFVGRYDVEQDALIEETQRETVIGFHAVWGDGEGRHYAVAGEFTPPFRGAALVRTLE